MIRSLQILRAIAALLVVFYHAIQEIDIPHDSWFYSLSGIGFAGVNLFFIISGFIMCYTTDSRTEPLKFIGRRLVRIAPLYWLILLFHGGFHSLTDPDTYISMLFIPLSVQSPPFLGFAAWTVGWTLNYEMFFYLVFSLSLLAGKFRMVAVYAVFAALHVLFMYLSSQTDLLRSFDPYTELPSVGSAYLSMMVNPMGLLFCVGMIAATVYKRFAGCPARYNCAVLTIAILGMILFFKTMYFDGHGPRTSFLCLMLFVGALSMERFIDRRRTAASVVQPLVYLGTISYSIYLLHMLFLNNFHIPSLPLPAWVLLLLSLVAILLASAMSYELIEKRLSGRLKRMLRL